MTFTVNLKYIHQFEKKAAAAYIEAGYRYARQKNADQSSEYTSVLAIIYTVLGQGFCYGYYGYIKTPNSPKKNGNNTAVAQRNRKQKVRFPPEYDYITDIVNQLIAIGGDDVLRMSIPH